MALADRVNDQTPKRVHGLPCSVGRLLDTLPEPEADALKHMLGNGWSQNQIYEALTAEGYSPGRQTINRHRSQSCRCFL